MFDGRISLNSVLLLLLVNFVSGFRLELMYISLIRSITSRLTHIHGLQQQLFCFYQKDKSSESKVKFRQASNHCKRVLEAVKLAYAHKTKESITCKKLDSWDIWQISNSVLNKVTLLYLLYSVAQRCCHLYLIKQNCFLETFLRTLILLTQVSLYLFSLLGLI